MLARAHLAQLEIFEKTLKRVVLMCCEVFNITFQVGGVDEYEICQAIKKGQITKPVVAWCIGTCAGMLSTEVGLPSVLEQVE